MDESGTASQVAHVVVRGLMAGKAVEIDGLGIFYPDAERFFRFEARGAAKVFIAYVVEDAPMAERLYVSVR